TVPMGSALGNLVRPPSGYAALCAEWAPPSGTLVRPPIAATPPSVPMGSALGNPRSAPQRLRRS
ncbi:MAG: hypothetical protein WAV20_12990, partial [Blastocatellia bacterium]